MDLPPTKEEEYSLNRSKKKIKSSDVSSDITPPEPNLEDNDGNCEEIMEEDYIAEPSMSKEVQSELQRQPDVPSTWGKSFKEAVMGKSSPAPIYFDSDDEKDLEAKYSMEEEDVNGEQSEEDVNMGD